MYSDHPFVPNVAVSPATFDIDDADTFQCQSYRRILPTHVTLWARRGPGGRNARKAKGGGRGLAGTGGGYMALAPGGERYKPLRPGKTRIPGAASTPLASTQAPQMLHFELL